MSMNLIIESYLRALEDARRVYDAIIDNTGDIQRAEETEEILKANAKKVFDERCMMYNG